MRRLGLVSVVFVVALSGCKPDVGACDQEESLRLVYDEQGVPAFAGQALMSANCASGFCHDSLANLSTSEGIPTVEAARAGAPADLTFDVRIVSTGAADVSPTAAVELARIERLSMDQERALRFRRDVWHQVRSHRMPPWDFDDPPPASDPVTPLRAAYDAAVGATAGYVLVGEDGTGEEPLPGLDTPEGRQILRNWLACGAPVVERTADYPGSENFVVPTCERTCVGVTWPAIVDGIIRQAGCTAGGCHDDSAFPAAQLGLAGEPAEIHARLLDAAPMGSQCEAGGTTEPMPEQGTPLLTAGDPDASLLLLKTELPGSDICGARMPLGRTPLTEQRLCALRAWIACGACPEPNGGACRDCLSDPDLLAGCNLAGFSDDPAGFECVETPVCQVRAEL